MIARIGLFAALLLLAPEAWAQPQSFYRVYQYEIPLEGWGEPALWNTYVARSSQSYDHFGRALGREGLWAHQAEVEYGLTDHFSLAGYATFEDPRGYGPQFIDGRVEGRYTFALPHDHFFDTAVYGEYVIPRARYGSEQEFEARCILQKDLNDFRIVFNPILSVPTVGSDMGHSPVVQLASALYYRRRLLIQPGLEIYNTFGPIDNVPRAGKQQHTVLPVVEMHPFRGITWNLGVGFGLTGSSDRLVVKSIFMYEFNAIRPSKLFRR